MLRSLTPGNTVLLVIDYQDKLLKIMDEAVTQRTVRNINLLTRMFRRWRAATLVTEQYVKGLGPTHPPVMKHLEGIAPIEKMTFSCCSDQAFENALKAAGKPNVVLTGMETHICVLQTALDLKARGYFVVTASDAVQSSTKFRWRSGLALMARAGIETAPTETVLFQLAGRCDTDDFKHLVQLLKDG